MKHLMFQKFKPHLKWITPLAIIILLALFFLSQNTKIILAVASPETILSSAATSQTLAAFKLKLKSGLPIFAASLKAAGLAVRLTKQDDNMFVGNVSIPQEWMNKPQTIVFAVYLNGIKTSGSLRFVITDIPIVLPPDPGDAGKQTLAGIDSDNDGVRDDLQREIVFMYPERDEVRRVLRAMVKKEQDVITTTGGHEHFKGLMTEYFAFWDCYNYMVFGNNVRNYTNGDILWYMGQNTPERKKTIEANQYKATPYASTSHYNSEACTQPLVNGQY